MFANKRSSMIGFFLLLLLTSTCLFSQSIESDSTAACQNCQALIPIAAKFCPKCGTKVLPPAPKPAIDTVEQIPESVLAIPLEDTLGAREIIPDFESDISQVDTLEFVEKTSDPVLAVPLADTLLVDETAYSEPEFFSDDTLVVRKPIYSKPEILSDDTLAVETTEYFEPVTISEDTSSVEPEGKPDDVLAESFYKIGMALFEKGAFGAAALEFQKIMSDYPDSRHSESATVMYLACKRLVQMEINTAQEQQAPRKKSSSGFSDGFLGGCTAIGALILLIATLAA